LPGHEPDDRIFLPFGTAAHEAEKLRDEGWIVVAGLSPVDDEGAEATRLHCTHIFAANETRKL